MRAIHALSIVASLVLIVVSIVQLAQVLAR
ncbi:hypothetical protein ATK30_2978 [Amycolatopsis echigonensis]|uniref:Uncharacterized protein n=1 Tax=Amycolatopsis echigonensis TaxID=2576905 RepID=A0A2N3WEA3_9PSEU|nr:hypothetical protein ATK30_2978 [Amycolatopsis niigatensis]